MATSDKPTFEHTAIIALGSNQQNPQAQVEEAINYLSKSIPDSQVDKVSSLYKTKPVGYLNQPDFINAVVVMKTGLDKYELLKSLHILEDAFGRKRSFPNAPRTLDLDIITYDNDKSDDSQLTLPHPRAFERAFVLIPLVEIAPDTVLSEKTTAKEWLDNISEEDKEGVKIIKPVKKNNKYISIAGVPGVGKTRLANKLASFMNARLVEDYPYISPFLGNFYQDIAKKSSLIEDVQSIYRESRRIRGASHYDIKYGLATQLDFLINRYEQLCLIQNYLEQGFRVVTDFAPHKDQLFANIILNRYENNLYNRVRKKIVPQVEPDLIIYLEYSGRMNQKQIQTSLAQRSIPMIQGLPAKYFLRVCEEYRRFLYTYKGRILIVNVDTIDLINNETHFYHLISTIINFTGRRSYLGLGSQVVTI